MRIRHGGRLKCLDGPVVIEGLRVVINGKAGKAAALPKFSDLLTLLADYDHPDRPCLT